MTLKPTAHFSLRAMFMAFIFGRDAWRRFTWALRASILAHAGSFGAVIGAKDNPLAKMQANTGAENR